MKALASKPLRKIILHSFVGGIAWAAGASLGLTILIALITFILRLLGGLPFIGEVVGQIVQYTQQYLNSTASVN